MGCSPGFADDVALQQVKLRLRPSAEEEVHMSWDLALRMLAGLFGRLPAAVQVLNDPQHGRHLQT